MPAVKTYNIGQLIVLRCEFRDDDGALSDPATVACRLRPPNGLVVVHPVSELRHVSVGVFELDVTPVAGQNGYWQEHWESTGDPEITDDRVFYVRDTPFD